VVACKGVVRVRGQVKDSCVTVMCYSLERSSDRPGTSGPQMHA